MRRTEVVRLHFGASKFKVIILVKQDSRLAGSVLQVSSLPELLQVFQPNDCCALTDEILVMRNVISVRVSVKHVFHRQRRNRLDLCDECGFDFGAWILGIPEDQSLRCDFNDRIRPAVGDVP